MKRNFIVFDTETNGMKNSAVLSISAIKLQYDFDDKKLIKIDEYDRYYYRNAGERINYGALKVHGLTDEVISEKRRGNDYPRYFVEDISSFLEFCKDTDHYIAHNISFDRSFIPFVLKHEFCTMLENVDIVKIKKANGNYKWPKLNELATYYKVPFDEGKLHGSLYDTTILGRIVYRMFGTEAGRSKLERFLRKS